MRTTEATDLELDLELTQLRHQQLVEKDEVVLGSRDQ